jgi:putative ABC transport system permease protein
MSAFLKTRKKEFGLMIMLGMTHTQLRKMVFLENVLIGFFATISGIVLGLVLSKLMLLASENFLQLDESLPFYMPINAILLALAAFIVLFVLISLFTVIILRANNLIDLIKGSSKPRTEPKSSILLSWLALILLVGGYAVAMIVKGVFVVYAMIPVTLVVIIGTYFLFTQLSVFLIHKSRAKRSFFWRGTNMLFLSDLAYRMKDNARTFFMVAVLSAVSFSAIGSLVGFKTMSTEILLDENPFAFEYVSYEGNESLAPNHLEAIDSALRAGKFDYARLQATMSEQMTDSGSKVTVVKASEYNAIAQAANEQTVQLSGDQAAMVYYANKVMGEKTEEKARSVRLSAGYELKPSTSISPTSLLIDDSYYVIADSLFDKLDRGETNVFYAFDVKGDYKKTLKIGRDLTEIFHGDNFRFQSLAYDAHQLTQGFGVVLFIGLFIGAVFFVAAGSFLYFRLYADLPEDKAKFASIMKLGLTDGELSKILTRQLLILFFAPIAVATVHGAIALNSLQRLFGYSLMRESFLVLGTFVLIQVVYFLLIRTRYIKQVLV